MLTYFTDRIFVYDDFLANNEAKDFAELIFGHYSANLDSQDEQKLATNTNVEKAVKEILTSALKEIPSAAVKLNPVFNLGRISSITMDICSANNSNKNFSQLDDQPSVLAYYVYYPMQQWEASWSGEIFIESGNVEGFGDFIHPQANRLVVIRPGVNFNFSKIDIQAPKSLTLLKGVVLAKKVSTNPYTPF